MQSKEGDEQVRRKLALLLILSLIMSIMPMGVFADDAPGVSSYTNGYGYTNGTTNGTTTPGGIEPGPGPGTGGNNGGGEIVLTTPSGLYLVYGNFDTRVVNFNSPTNFAVAVNITREAYALGFRGVQFEWLRNGQVWDGDGGSGFVAPNDVNWGNAEQGSASIAGVVNLELHLPGGVPHEERGGEWSLGVALVDHRDDALPEERTRTITVSIMPPVGQGGGAGPGPGQGPAPSRQPSVTVVNRVTVVSVSTTNVTINNVISQSIREGKQPRVEIVLRPRQSGVSVTSNNIKRLIEHRGSLVIKQQTVNITINYTQMAQWNVEAGTNVTINVTEVTGENEQDQKFRRLRRKPRNVTTTVELTQMFVTVVQEVTVNINRVVMQNVQSTISVNVNNKGLTALEKSRLVGLFFFLENPDDEDSLNYMLISGYLDEDGYFHIEIPGNGWFTLILAEPGEAPEAPGDDDQDQDDDHQGDQDDDDQGQGGNNQGQATREPTTLRVPLGQTFFVQDGVMRQMDVMPFVETTTGYTMLPLRAIAESLGSEVSWVSETSTVVLVRNEVNFSFSIGQPIPGVSGTSQIVNDRTFVTSQFLEVILGTSISWDEETQSIYIND
jgi:hypothetical protein